MKRIVFAAALLASCQQQETRPPEQSPPAPTTPARAQPKPGDVVDVQGISVKYLDGGAIQISGRDRWGNALDTTYENVEFLRNALPVLERSVTAEQATGLRALIAH
jgi:hypothetical protein